LLGAKIRTEQQERTFEVTGKDGRAIAVLKLQLQLGQSSGHSSSHGSCSWLEALSSRVLCND